jgi:hypothetical protein
MSSCFSLLSSPFATAALALAFSSAHNAAVLADNSSFDLMLQT